MARPQTFSKKENEKKKSEVKNCVSFVFHIGRFFYQFGKYRFKGILKVWSISRVGL